MFGFLKPNVRMQSGFVPPLKFDINTIKVDTTPIKARVIAVHPSGILGRAWHMATKDFLPNAAVTLGTVASNVLLDKSLDLLIRSLPMLLSTVSWTSRLALSAIPPSFHFIRSHWSTISNSLWRVWTWGSPAAVVANSTSLPAEIRHVIVDQTSRPDMLALVRKRVEEITNPTTFPQVSLSSPADPSIPPVVPVVETVHKAVETIPTHSWLYYIGWAVIGIGLLSGGMKALDYCITNYGFHGPVQPSFLSKVPIVNTEPPTYFDSFYYYVLQPFDQIAGILVYGVGFIWAGLTLKAPVSSKSIFEEEEEVELIDKRIGKLKLPPEAVDKRGILELPSEMINASPTAKAKYLAELKQKELSDLQLNNLGLKQTNTNDTNDVIDRILNNLQLEEMEKIMTSPNYVAWQSEPEKIAAALEQISQSSDRMAAIVQVFGCF